MTSKIHNKEKKAFYTKMLRIRIIEEELARYYTEQEMRCPVHFCIGQEAIAVGICQSLKKTDTVMSNHRSHGHYLAKGGNLKRMVAELYGRITGCSYGIGGSMHLIDTSVNFLGATSIVAGTIPVTVGVGFSNKLRHKRSVAVVFFGDAATEEGVFYESLNFAALHRLPVLFVCENNFYSVYSHISVRQPKERKIFKVAQSLGVDSIRLDGNDVEEVYRTSQKALRSIRLGKGPFLMEAITYRHLEHCGPNYDNALGYRTEDEFLCWQKKDPLPIYEKRLLQESVITEKSIKALRTKIMMEVTESVNYAKSSEFPGSDLLTRHVYAE